MKHWLLALIGVYALCVLWAYQQTPLGQVALLDARENIALARELSSGSPQPAYRYCLYPSLLSLFSALRDSQLLLLGQYLNIALHLATALGVAFCAYILWGKRLGALLAGGLYGIYPVALYLSLDLLDTTLALFLGCWGLYFFLRAHTQEPRAGLNAFFSISLFLLAGLTRGHFLTWAGVASVVFVIEALQSKEGRCRLLGASLAGALTLGVFYSAETLRTGHFRALPLQTSYNLYASNAPGATPSSYRQKIEFVDLPEGLNPARAEAELLYRRATNSWGPLGEETINHYWQARFFHELTTDPLQKIGLYAQKLYGFFNNHEGYNNKTYAFQKELLWPLKLNPLGFTLLLVGALLALFFYRPLPALTGLVGLFIVFYIFPSALFYASDRFRLPLALLLCLLCAGLPSALLQLAARWSQQRQQHLAKLLSIALLGLFSALPLFGLAKTKTQGADELLLAQASLTLSKDLEATRWATAARQSQPRSQAAVETLLLSQYNLLLSGQLRADLNWFRTSLADARTLPTPSDAASYVLGYYEWMAEGNRDSWHNLVALRSPTQTPHALAALAYTGGLYPHELELLKQLAPSSRPIQIALAALGDNHYISLLASQIGQESTQATLLAYRKLFDRAGLKPFNK